MSTDTTYNGWTNYETWNAKLWIDNEYGPYQEARECAGEERDAYALSEILKERFDDWFLTDIPTTGPAADILNAGLSEINWREIAESFISDTEEDENQ